MGIYDDWVAANPDQSDKQIANVEFCLKAIDEWGGRPATIVLSVADTGSNNAHTSINNAIAALPSGGGKIILLEGTYNLGSYINVNKDNVTIQGMGPSTILNLTNAISGVTGIITMSSNYCRVADLRVTNSTSINVTNGIYISGSNNIIEKCFVSSSSGSGGIWGVLIKFGANYNTVSNNIFDLNVANRNCTAAVDINGGNYNLIIGNIIRHNSEDGVYGIYLGDIQGCQHNCIIGNSISPNSRGDTYSSIGIYLSNANTNSHIDDNIIVNNTIANTSYGPARLFAILVDSKTARNLIMGNNLRGVIDAGRTAYTTNGTSAVTLPGSPTTIGSLPNGGVCGFNIV